ncbi:TadG family pilus assembly protein [Caldovatus aquaticus]|uniref:DUF2134 domain-containing protein n=1 Tax=Caldovatus aquaticus TaxID=2865671 RepID=A0ABS7F0P7_9PROT|nr:TadG family pilus assembly protein [Caldovatus aquaticus]MBW8269078.1 hypothetical protein [Caldovatus aquaticus]
MTAARVPSEQLPAGPVDGAALAAPRPVSGRTGAAPARPGGAAAARRRPLRAVLRDRRGATALVFAASAVALFGFAALATEGGNWYFNHRNARSAADMAALAGASAYARASTDNKSAAEAVAKLTAQNNGFVSGTDSGTNATTKVTVDVGVWTPPSPPYPAGSSAVPGSVRVTIERQVPTFLAGLFLGSDAVTIRVRATAAVLDNGGEACILATAVSGIGLDMIGTADVKASNCVLHSNSRGSSSVRIQSGFASALEALGVSAVGGCFGNSCNSLPNVPGHQVQTNAWPVENPYDALQDVVESYTNGKPTNGPAGCYQVPNQALRQTEATALAGSIVAKGGVLCAANNNRNLSLRNNVTLTLPPNRTYVFWNAGLDLANGTLNCSGCTFIFTGANGQGGAVRINGGATIRMDTYTSGTPNPPLPIAISPEPIVGVSMFRDERSSNNLPGGGAPVQINGSSQSYINGALVFANSEIRYNGNYTGAGSTGPACVVVIGKTIEFSGTARLNTSGCKAAGVRTPLIRVVRLVE